MIRANPLHLPTAETLAPGLTPDSARLTRSPPSTPSPHLFPIDLEFGSFEKGLKSNKSEVNSL
jgi:hypothetical protein